MAANVETMAYVRETPWHGMGTRVEEVMTSGEALKKAGLDWQVIPKRVFVEGQKSAIPNLVANVRDTDDAILGVVGKDYKIVQNSEAFAFTDALVGEGCRYETAGSLAGGKRVFMLAKMPDKLKLLGDKVEPYIVFSNMHDGSGSIRIACTPVRVVCQNTLNLALKTANRQWASAHKGDIAGKMVEAEETLMLARTYFKSLAGRAEELAEFHLRRGQIEEILEAMFPISAETSQRIIENKNASKSEIIDLLSKHDIQRFGKDNAWSFLNAVSDWAAHRTPQRNAKTYAETNFMRVIDGHPALDQATAIIGSMMKAA